jgi:hypothetical protein
LDGCIYFLLLAINPAIAKIAIVGRSAVAAGGAFWEKLTEPRPRLRWLRVALPAVVFVPDLAAVPLVLPVLPPARIVPYMEGLGIKPT